MKQVNAVGKALHLPFSPTNPSVRSVSAAPRRRRKHGVCNFSGSNGGGASSPSGSSPSSEGDRRKQELLARIAMIQAQKVRLTEFLDERSEYLTQFAESANAEFDQIGEDALKELDEASARILGNLESRMQEFEESAEVNRQEIEKNDKILEEFEEKIERDRNEGLFFKNLREAKKKPEEEAVRAQAKAEARKLKRLEKEKAGSGTRRNVYLGLMAVLGATMANAVAFSPEVEWRKVAALGFIFLALLAQYVYEADYVWRIILMFGALPAALTYYWRMKMPETARYTALVAKNAKQAAADMSKVLKTEIGEEQAKVERQSMDRSNDYGLFSREFALRHGLHLLGTTTTWFLLDIAFYSQNLFQKEIFSAIEWIPKAATMNAIEEVFRIARAQTLIALCGTVPGYWFTVALIDHIGRFTIQVVGFFFMTVFMLALAIPYHHWTQPSHRIGFVVMYGLTFFFANFGPNSTTFIVPAEIFPARLRSTCHGISAASGKAGAIIGSFGFLYAAQNQDKTKADAGYPAGIGIKNSLFVLAACNLLGLLFTFLVPESKGKSLEEMSGENESGDEPAEAQISVGDLSRTINHV